MRDLKFRKELQEHREKLEAEQKQKDTNVSRKAPMERSKTKKGQDSGNP